MVFTCQQRFASRRTCCPAGRTCTIAAHVSSSGERQGVSPPSAIRPFLRSDANSQPAGERAPPSDFPQRAESTGRLTHDQAGTGNASGHTGELTNHPLHCQCHTAVPVWLLKSNFESSRQSAESRVWSTSNVDEVPDAATTAKVNQRFVTPLMPLAPVLPSFGDSPTASSHRNTLT